MDLSCAQRRRAQRGGERGGEKNAAGRMVDSFEIR